MPSDSPYATSGLCSGDAGLCSIATTTDLTLQFCDMPSAIEWRDLVSYCDTKLLIVNETPGLLFIKRTDVLPQDLVKFRNREIGC